MSDYDEDAEFDELPAALRKQLKAKDKQLNELLAQYEQVAKRDRERTLSDALTAKGLPAKVAKLMPADMDPTPEAVESWLTDYADVFGIQKAATQQQAVNDTPPVPDAWQRIQSISQTTSSESGESAALHSINSATTEADLMKLILDAGGGAL